MTVRSDFSRKYQTPDIGFGCSSLMASLDRCQSLEVLAAVENAGVTHFDVARSYGYGEAEGVLGEFAKGRREKITITTKFGIQPPSRHLSRGPVISMARSVARLMPWLRPMMRRRAAGLVRAGVFDVDAARTSLETSLRQLRTDYIDHYLLHECDAATVQDGPLRRFLDDALRAGKIRSYGVAVSREVMLQLSGQIDDDAISVVQVPDDLTRRDCFFGNFRNKVVYLHSALSRTFALLEQSGMSDPEIKARSSELGFDLSDRGTLATFALASARARYPQSCTLFTSRDPRRAALSVASLRGAPPHEEQLHAFEAFVTCLALGHTSATVRVA